MVFVNKQFSEERSLLTDHRQPLKNFKDQSEESDLHSGIKITIK